jgi:UDP-N-acetylglucosamine 2-epimerase (non-hydrolysing)
VRVLKPIIVVAGTRPEAIKLSPLFRWLKKFGLDFLFVWSGQHYSYTLSEVFFKELELPVPDINLDIRSGSHSNQTAKAMIGLEDFFSRIDSSLIIAEGDTNTVLASALTANKCQIPFAHVEAGLRSYDKTMPEEINRIIADSCSEVLFAPTDLSFQNLVHEGISNKKIWLTGNTIVDVVKQYGAIVKENAMKVLDELKIEPKEFLLLTLHRQESTDILSRFKDLISAICSLSERYKVVFPIHPRTKNKLETLGLINNLKNKKNLMIIPPLGYFKFLGLMSNCLTVLTDSGGVQEEAVTLGVPTVTLRYNTERPESVLCGFNVLAGTIPKSIIQKTDEQIKRYDDIKNSIKIGINPFGDGNSGKKIASILKNLVNSGIKVETTDTTKDPYIVYVLVDLEKLRTFDFKNLKNCEILAIYDSQGCSVGSEFRNNQDLESKDESHKVLVRVPLTLAKKLQK